MDATGKWITDQWAEAIRRAFPGNTKPPITEAPRRLTQLEEALSSRTLNSEYQRKRMAEQLEDEQYLRFSYALEIHNLRDQLNGKKRHAKPKAYNLVTFAVELVTDEPDRLALNARWLWQPGTKKLSLKDWSTAGDVARLVFNYRVCGGYPSDVRKWLHKLGNESGIAFTIRDIREVGRALLDG